MPCGVCIWKINTVCSGRLMPCIDSGITELPGFASVSVGGHSISAGGLGVLSHCCPLRDNVKTVSFTVAPA